MSISRVTARYAKSLIELASERGELETVKKDMDYFLGALQSRELVLFLKSPIISADKKRSVFHAVFDGKISKTTFEFFRIVIQKGREEYLQEIVKEFIEQYKQINGISTVTITTAAPMTESALSEIKAKLLASNETMDKLDIHTLVDPDIIGGFIIEIGDKSYDASVAHTLENLKKELTAN